MNWVCNLCHEGSSAKMIISVLWKLDEKQCFWGQSEMIYMGFWVFCPWLISALRLSDQWWYRCPSTILPPCVGFSQNQRLCHTVRWRCLTESWSHSQTLCARTSPSNARGIKDYNIMAQFSLHSQQQMLVLHTEAATVLTDSLGLLSDRPHKQFNSSRVTLCYSPIHLRALTSLIH